MLIGWSNRCEATLRRRDAKPIKQGIQCPLSRPAMLLAEKAGLGFHASIEGRRSMIKPRGENLDGSRQAQDR